MTTNDEQREADLADQARKSFPRFRWNGRFSRSEKRWRLFRIGFLGGSGPGYGAPDNYNSALSVGIELKIQDAWIGAFWKGNRDEWFVWICILPCVPLRLHYQRAYGGWIMPPRSYPEPRP